MPQILDAIAPQRNATVSASAGTGKTWLLVSRIVRLLLAGARPDGILAVTFTRKAAAEMHGRLGERLRLLATADAQALDAGLRQLGLEPDAELRERARGLFERLLFAERPLRTTTFHAFCQELLRRFPLEAEIPPGFELIESTGLFEVQAWEALYAEASRHPDGSTAQALETLFLACGGLHNTQSALSAFLGHRGDWWAFVETRAEAVAFASEQLRARLDVDPQADPCAALFASGAAALADEFRELLLHHPTKGNVDAAAAIAAALEPGRACAERYRDLRHAFFTKAGEPRARKASGVQAKKLGDTGQARLLELHEEMVSRCRFTDERLARLQTFHLSRAWYRAGSRLLDHYQRLKREQRVLDFTDLEWKSYQLLNHAEHGDWIQYKLDQRVEHLLIDEFQDTNPTQWRLVLPLLQEMAAAPGERSVFLVGDVKQSIYRFRRAEPRLMATAADWLQAAVGADRHSMALSRRSAPAITEAVNHLFGGSELGARLAHFEPHDTVHRELWGRVELLPLIEAAAREETDELAAGLRDPLTTPREIDEDLRHLEEGRAIAARLRALHDGKTLLGPADAARPFSYDDAVVLLRSRTHAATIEHALRDAGIPYLGAGRGTLLESLEVRDMVTLLELLVTPFSNLALAQVLRSPLFAAGDEELMRLSGAPRWFERLQALAPELPPDGALARAAALLPRWHALTDIRPVHDLLDLIYGEAAVIARYQAAFPPALHARVEANLTRFIELALEVDSGRYPSLAAFLARLRSLRERADEAPDEAPAGGGEPRVRLMTIHASKGLEAPVVFLADAASTTRERNAFHPIVDWPADAARPADFLLAGRSAEQDEVSRTLLERNREAERREEANLLYVAMTRARQLLIVSGAAPSRGEALGWYGALSEALAPHAREQADGTLLLESNTPPPHATVAAPAAAAAPPLDPRLHEPLTTTAPWREIAPSATAASLDHAPGDEDGRLRGLLVHRLLALLGDGGNDPGDAPLIRRLALEFALGESAALLAGALSEARAVLADPTHAGLLDPTRYRRAWSEVPIQFERDGTTVYGVIDRLVENDDGLWLVDYKTHRGACHGHADALAASYAGQLELYAEGIRRLFPGRPLRAGLLFTACSLYREVPLKP